MALHLRELIAKDRAGQPLTPEERQYLEAEAARRAQEAGVDQALGRQPPLEQVMSAQEPQTGGGLGAMLADAFGQALDFSVTPGAMPQAIYEGAQQAAPALMSLGETIRGEVPPGMEATPEFSPMRFNPMMGFAGPDMPITDRLRLAAGAAIDRRPEAQRDMIANTLGDQVSFDEDALGNLLMNADGQEMYINRPGFTPADARDVVADVAAFLPAGRVANLARNFAAQAPTMVSRVGRALTGAGATSATAAGTEAGRQSLGELFGSEQGVDPADAAIAGGSAVIGERLMPGFRQWTPKARGMIREAEGMGLNLRGGPGEQVLQARQAAANAGQPPLAGTLEPGQGRTASVGYTGFSDLQPNVQARRQRELDRVNALYDDPETGARVRGREAFVSTDEVRGLNERVQQSVQNLDLPPEGATRRLLNQMDEVSQIENGRIRVTPMEEWRRNVNARLNTLGNPSDAAGRQERRALINAKNEYDQFMDEQFARDMVSGDEGAIQAWRDAREGWKEYAKRFEEDRFLQTLAQNDMLNPTEVRNLIFGASKLPTTTKAVGPAEKTIKRLNSIFGPDSNEMQAIRAEVAADITAPLFGNTPDIGKFVDNFDTMMRQNRPLMEELWPQNLEDGLELVKYAKTIRNRRGARAPGPLDPAVERMWNLANAWAVGHGLARGQARLNLSRGLIDKIRQAGGGAAARRRILHEALGTDPTQRIIPFGTGAVAGPTAQNAMDERNRTQEPVGEQPAVQVDPEQAEQTGIRSIMNKARKNPDALTARERQILQREAQRLLETQRED